jgi:hypothetical protein
MRKVAVAVGRVLGLFLIGRAAAELFVLDMSDPATYRDARAGQAWSAYSWSTADRVWWQPSPSPWPLLRRRSSRRAQTVQRDQPE